MFATKIGLCPGLGIALRTMGRLFGCYIQILVSGGSCFRLLLRGYERNAVPSRWAYSYIGVALVRIDGGVWKWVVRKKERTIFILTLGG